MKVLVEPFWVQKQGNSPEEYEDAAFPVERQEYDQGRVQVAVADGATESIFARRWAEQLVSAVGNGDLSPNCISESVRRLRRDWQEWLVGKALPWYAEEKARQGTFAALITLELTEDPSQEGGDGYWQAAAVGDSCLFHVREQEILTSFPLTTAAAFDNRPVLLGSTGGNDDCPESVATTGRWKNGDVFYLMTDALACWFLKHIDAGESPVAIQGDFCCTGTEDTFRTWVGSLRRDGSLRNDDCTLVRVRIW